MANSKIKSDNMDFLFDCILSLQSMDECYDFFEDLCTVNELQAISQRIVVAKMLSELFVFSDSLIDTVGASASIWRVYSSLQFCCYGYEKLFERVAARKKDAQ